MLTDAVAIALALLALRLARRPPAGSFTYGMKRAEILSAADQRRHAAAARRADRLSRAIRRLIDPPDVEGGLVLIVAVVGIGVNLVARCG